MIPFFEIETSALLRKLLADHWIAWAGPPQEMVLDPARTNLGDQMAAPCELEGTLIRSIAAGAHWQLGKPSHMEVGLHTCLARWSNRTSLTVRMNGYHVIAILMWKTTWFRFMAIHLNHLSLVEMYTSLHIPEDLLNEPSFIVPATVSLSEESVARSQAMRTSARMALIQLQDSRAMRVYSSFGPTKTCSGLYTSWCRSILERSKVGSWKTPTWRSLVRSCNCHWSCWA